MPIMDQWPVSAGGMDDALQPRSIARSAARRRQPETIRYRHDWTALGDRYIDRGLVWQRVVVACQRPRARRNLADRPPFPWRGDLGGAIVRLGWRLSYAYLPPFPQNMPKVQQRLAKTSEYGLYALLLFQPLTGLAQSLTRGRHFMLFAWQVPKVMAGDKPLTMLFHQIHAVSAWVLLGLIGLHILAALFHRFVLRDEVLQSMLPWRASPAAGRAPKSLLATHDSAAR